MAEIQERLESLEKEAKSIQSQVAEVCLVLSFLFSMLGHFSVLSVVTSLKF